MTSPLLNSASIHSSHKYGTCCSVVRLKQLGAAVPRYNSTRVGGSSVGRVSSTAACLFAVICCLKAWPCFV